MPKSDTKQRILNAASELFYQNGYSETTVAEIIEYSQTNKGSFYHHFDDKPHLGYDIYQGMLKAIDDCIRNLYPTVQTIDRFFLQECLFWRLLFQEPQIRRFAAGLLTACSIDLKAEFFDAILDLSSVDLSTRELLMIQGVELSVRCWFTAYVHNIIERLREEELVSFYLRSWLCLYHIPPDVVDSYLITTNKLMCSLSIDNDVFQVSVRFTEDKHSL